MIPKLLNISSSVIRILKGKEFLQLRNHIRNIKMKNINTTTDGNKVDGAETAIREEWPISHFLLWL